MYIKNNLDEARQKLRDIQKHGMLTFAPPVPIEPEEKTQPAIDSLLRTKAYTKRINNEYALRGPFKYEIATEDQRIDTAKKIILRTQPGPYEDANYFSLIAYQAASVEMVLNMYKQALFDNYILGTVHTPSINAFAGIWKDQGTVSVGLNSGIIDFIYQCAKCVIQYANPVETKSNKAAVNIDINKIHDVENLTNKEAAVKRLYETLESYFFFGYPRAHAYEFVPDEQHPPLTLLISLAERWVIAHEYGHGLFDREKMKPKEGVDIGIAEEYYADANATILNVLSASLYDHVPPEFALSGANFVLGCIEVLQRAFSIILSGIEAKNQSDNTHPSNIDRLKQNFYTFRQFFDVAYYPDGNYHLDFVIRSEAPATHNFGPEKERQANYFSNLLLEVWDESKVILIQDYNNRRPLHPMWV